MILRGEVFWNSQKENNPAYGKDPSNVVVLTQSFAGAGQVGAGCCALAEKEAMMMQKIPWDLFGCSHLHSDFGLCYMTAAAAAQWVTLWLWRTSWQVVFVRSIS